MKKHGITNLEYKSSYIAKTYAKTGGNTVEDVLIKADDDYNMCHP